MISQDVAEEYAIAEEAQRKGIGKLWIPVLLAGIVIYALIYAYAESLVLETSKRNRLFMIHSAENRTYDFVVLGASHAMPFNFEDMNQRLEGLTDSSIINLSIEGAGPVPARFLTDYFLANHSTKNVLYIIDSFAYYSDQWNEVRIDDPELLARAPFDWDLLLTLWNYPSTRGLIPGYLTGFFKINNHDRFEPDVSDSELSKFTRTYRTNARVDERRMAFLYPENLEESVVDKYVGELDKLASTLADNGVNLVAIKTPLPERVLTKLESEEAFDTKVEAVLSKYNFALHDFTTVANDDAFFYDTDHLNKDGVINFMDAHLVSLLNATKAP